MGLSERDRKTIVELEIEKAHRFLNQAEKRRDEEEWDSAVNRYYYACFHIVQALFVKNGLFAKTHSGLIRVLGENFIKTGKLADEHGAFLSMLMSLRQKADYNCAFDLRPKDITMCVEKSPLFIEAVERLIG